MNYAEITAMALSYADTEDTEVVANIDNFLRIVEARVNRVLQVGKMAVRTVIDTVIGQEYYGLPDGFSALRDIEIYSPGSPGNKTTLSYVSPEQMNHLSSTTSTTNSYYTIIADQLQILPTTEDKVLELVYYKDLTPLDAVNTTNWLSDRNPDTYVFGLLVELNSFVKDADAKMLWDERFIEATSEIIRDDAFSRWSGTALQIRTG